MIKWSMNYPIWMVIIPILAQLSILGLNGKIPMWCFCPDDASTIPQTKGLPNWVVRFTINFKFPHIHTYIYIQCPGYCALELDRLSIEAEMNWIDENWEFSAHSTWQGFIFDATRFNGRYWNLYFNGNPLTIQCDIILLQ